MPKVESQNAMSYRIPAVINHVTRESGVISSTLDLNNAKIVPARSTIDMGVNRLSSRTSTIDMGVNRLSSRTETMIDIQDQLRATRSRCQFQFVWLDETETVSNIAMSFLTSPALMTLRTSDQIYFFPMTFDLANITSAQLSDWLFRVAAGNETAYGGTSFLMRVRRLLFDILSTVLSIWQASRWLFLLMFGLPTLIISIICYSLCCMEAIDDDGTYDSEDEDGDGEGEEQGDVDGRSLYDGPPPPAFSRSGPLPSYKSLKGGDSETVKPQEEKKNE